MVLKLHAIPFWGCTVRRVWGMEFEICREVTTYYLNPLSPSIPTCKWPIMILLTWNANKSITLNYYNFKLRRKSSYLRETKYTLWWQNSITCIFYSVNGWEDDSNGWIFQFLTSTPAAPLSKASTTTELNIQQNNKFYIFQAYPNKSKSVWLPPDRTLPSQIAMMFSLQLLKKQPKILHR